MVALEVDVYSEYLSMVQDMGLAVKVRMALVKGMVDEVEAGYWA